MPAAPYYDISTIDFNKPVFTQEQIREVNPQRFEMEQLTAIVHVDRDHHGAVGYKDVTDKEFWIAGHMPGYPLMPGVIQCECAAQLAGFYARKFDLIGGDYLGFGGMNDVRFRRPVFPNSRLVLMAKLTRLKENRRAEFTFQGYVDGKLCFDGEMIGVPIPREERSDAVSS